MFNELSNEELYYPKELSWLAFNERVLQEAADKNNPIIERIRFLGIYSSNMDEFYRVRVANLRRKALIQKNNDHLTAAEHTLALLSKVQEKVNKLASKFDVVYKGCFSHLKSKGIILSLIDELSDNQKAWLKEYFHSEVLRHIAPILIEKKVDLVKRLNDSSTYLYLAIHRDGKNPRFATIEVPSQNMKRFIILPKERGAKVKRIVLLEDIIEHCIEDIFRGFIKFDKIECYSFKMTRDSEYTIDDDIADSYVEKMSDSMKQRLIAEPVRVIYDAQMPTEMVKSLKKHLKHTSDDNLIAGGRTRNVKEFLQFPNIGRKNLENNKLTPLTSAQFANFDTVFDAIRHQDILLYYPYHRFLHFTEFVRQAAFDPHVRHIRITMYRIASHSRIVSSLIDAVDNGKMVTVVVELRARFDEEANIAWAKTMTDAGIRVIFGNPAFKIHTKICVASREEKGELNHYAHIGTGNFNEKTAKIYTDFSLFTFNQDVAAEVIKVFDMIQYPYRQQHFDHLMVSPINNKTKIIELIEQETRNKQNGLSAKITFKVNNLVDRDIIDKLYEASQAGVKIKGIVRGMCSLRAGVKGLSDNIYIISIVDRFLEHPRVMMFENAGEPKVYLSSADWMRRNMRDRIEVTGPVYDPRLIKQISDIFEMQFRDTLKARVVDKNQVNQYVKRGNRKHARSQIDTYQYLRQLEKVEYDRNKNST